MKILLIKQTSLGDVLHITPVIRALKKWKEDCQIDVIIDKRAVSILENSPYINKLYILDIYKYENDKSIACKNVTSGEEDAKVYEVICKDDRSVLRYEFEPDEEMLEAMRMKYARIIIK